MGLYVRQSVSVGPFRFNLSKSGVGVSVGVKGFRVGTGPRGNYVHMGAGGLYYRATLPPAGQPQSAEPQPRLEAPPGDAPPAAAGRTYGPAVAIESAATNTIVDSSSAALLQELRDKQRASEYWPLVLGAAALLMLIGYAKSWPAWSLVLFAIAGGIGTYFVHARDMLRKTAVVFYEFEAELGEAFRRLHSAGAALANCGMRWHVATTARVHDRRYHAGAGHVITRAPTTISSGAPPIVKTNIDTIAIGVGKQTLHFFPDRVLVFEGNSVGAVSYQELGVSWDSTRFVEDGQVPHDAKVVDHTWRYPNKDGSPDRRFKDNRQIPVCLYGELSFTSKTGLNELVQLSKSDVVAEFAAALQDLAKKLPSEQIYKKAAAA